MRIFFSSLTIAGILTCLSVGTGFSQDASAPRVPRNDDVVAEWIRLNETPERLTHENRTELTVLARDIRSGNAMRARSAVDRIGRLTDDRREIAPELTDLLVFVVARPFLEQSRSRGAGNVSPLLRIRALELLGNMGGQRARTSLLLTVQRESDSAVVRAALSSLKELSPEPTAEVSRALTQVLQRHRSAGNPEVVSAVLRAVAALDRAPYTIKDPALFTAIMQVAQGPFPRNVRSQAYQVLDDLRRR